jgi:hypothetical protein
MDIRNLTQEQRKEMLAQLKEQEKAEKDRINREREAYQKLRNDTVSKWYEKLSAISRTITMSKSELFSDFDTVIALRDELYKTKTDRRSTTLTDGKSRAITLGYRIIETYDDTLDAGIQKVKEYLKSLARDEESAALVGMITQLLTKDRKGNLKANRIVELSQLAEKKGNPLLSEGIKIIQASYRPAQSCRFVEAKAKDEQGKDSFLPLSMSAADISDTQ